MKARVEVMLRNDIFDPQGKAIKNALSHLGFDDVNSVKVGKVFYIESNISNKETFQKELEKMSDSLLANVVIENYKIEILE